MAATIARHGRRRDGPQEPTSEPAGLSISNPAGFISPLGRAIRVIRRGAVPLNNFARFYLQYTSNGGAALSESAAAQCLELPVWHLPHDSIVLAWRGSRQETEARKRCGGSGSILFSPQIWPDRIVRRRSKPRLPLM